MSDARPLHAIALSAQINIDPARRTYDDATRERLVELFGPPERWASTTRSFLWTQVGALVPGFEGSADFTLTVPCTYDLELSAAKYFYSLPDGEIPLTFHFSGTILFSEEGNVQIAMVPWSCSARFKLAVEDWKRMMALVLPRRRLGAAADLDARPAAGAQGRRRGCRRSTPAWRSCSMLDALVDTLLYEGYALYPYTPGATKNATPTPFGIVYPPVYAAGSGATFDELQIQCCAAGAAVSRRGPLPPGQRRAPPGRGAPRRPPRARRGGGRGPFDFDGLRGRASIRFARRAHDDPRREPHARSPAGLDRGEALRHSLLSTHVVGRVSEGRFVSPLEAAGCEQINSWPVLATQEDDAVLGAAIMLPDHPQIAPESKGNLFDSTEIEEALLIHVLALSDEEREAAAAQDPAVRQMLERAARTTPQELMDLHGRVTVADPREGEPSAEVDGVRLPARRQGRAAAGRQRDAAGPPRRGPPRRRSSGSTTTTTAPCTSPSPSTTSPART